MKKIVLVDGNNLLFRSFYATSYQGNIMKNSKGFPTNALYGFINMMNKIIKEEKPSYLLVAFDKGKTFRHDKYDDYKAGRMAMPDELKLQFPKAKDVLDAMGIKHFEIDNYEADDIVGTLAKLVDIDNDFIATIVSSDKDLLQLISPDVVVKLLKQKDYIMMTEEEFRKIYGVDPIKMIDLKALMGDASDNIPGVKGIGEKTAINLISKYGSLEELYNNIDSVGGKTKEKLINDKDAAFMSYDIATIYREVPLGFGLEDCKYDGYDNDKLYELLNEFEFHSLLKKLSLNTGSTNNTNLNSEKNNIEVRDISLFDQNKPFSFYVEVLGSNYSKGRLIGVSLYDGEYSYFIDESDINKYSYIFENNIQKFTYDLKKCIVVLNKYNIRINNCVFDTMVGCYMLDYNLKDDLAFVAQAFDYNIPLYEEFFGTEKRPKEFSVEELKSFCGLKAKFIYKSRGEIQDGIHDFNEDDLFYNVEMPLINVLADMEMTGIKLDVSYLDNAQAELEEKMDLTLKKIYSLAGMEFNVMSPAQLSKVLFEVLEIPYPKRVKNGKYSTSKDILDKIINKHPIVSEVLDYRALTKLYTNYVVGLKSEVREDRRIHTSYTQTLTRTGRLSSVSPNLQNIPARDEYSRLIRKAFVPDPDSVLLSSDYSQVELRVFASMSGEEHLIEAFKSGLDIHTKTASDIYHVPVEDVTKAMRRTAKAVNFGIVYGISSFGLSEDLGIDIKTAKEFLDNYLNTYSGITEYMEQEKKDAYTNGFVTTLMNRRRVIEELKNKNYLIRSSGERMALNTPIQGTAADIMKKAMIDVYDELIKRGLKSKILLQVHDEIILNVINSELEEVKEIVKYKMENAFKLKVPLEVDIQVGNNWYEAK